MAKTVHLFTESKGATLHMFSFHNSHEPLGIPHLSQLASVPSPATSPATCHFPVIPDGGCQTCGGTNPWQRHDIRSWLGVPVITWETPKYPLMISRHIAIHC